MSDKKEVNVEDLNSKLEKIDAAVAGFEKLQEKIEEKGMAALAGASSFSHPIAGADSDEKKAMRAYGVSHVKDLVKVNTAERRFKHVPAQYRDMVLTLKENCDVARMTAQLFRGSGFDHFGDKVESDRIAKVKGVLDTKYGKEVYGARLKAFGSTIGGAGDEWVPTLLSSSWVEEFELERALEQRFQVYKMRGNPDELPVQNNVTKARRIGENTQITDSNFGTGKLQFNAVKIGEHYVMPEELDEDSAPAIMQAARSELIQSQERAVESAILNGDDDGTHIDSDTQAAGADVAEKLWPGLRALAIANAANGSTIDFGNSAVTEALLKTQRSRGDKFMTRPSGLLWVAGPQVYQQLVGLPNVSTVDKFGSNATILKGELAMFQGIPIIVSEHMREDLADTGVYDGVTTDRGGLLLLNLSRFYIGSRRPIMVKVGPDLAYHDRMLMSSYQRKDFVGHAQSASEVSVTYGINIAV